MHPPFHFDFFGAVGTQHQRKMRLAHVTSKAPLGGRQHLFYIIGTAALGQNNRHVDVKDKGIMGLMGHNNFDDVLDGFRVIFRQRAPGNIDRIGGAGTGR